MTDQLDANGVRRLARVGGLLYLAIIVIGAMGEGHVNTSPGDRENAWLLCLVIS